MIAKSLSFVLMSLIIWNCLLLHCFLLDFCFAGHYVHKQWETLFFVCLNFIWLLMLPVENVYSLMNSDLLKNIWVYHWNCSENLLLTENVLLLVWVLRLFLGRECLKHLTSMPTQLYDLGILWWITKICSSLSKLSMHKEMLAPSFALLLLPRISHATII